MIKILVEYSDSVYTNLPYFLVGLVFFSAYGAFFGHNFFYMLLSTALSAAITTSTLCTGKIIVGLVRIIFGSDPVVVHKPGYDTFMGIIDWCFDHYIIATCIGILYTIVMHVIAILCVIKFANILYKILAPESKVSIFIFEFIVIIVLIVVFLFATIIVNITIIMLAYMIVGYDIVYAHLVEGRVPSQEEMRMLKQKVRKLLG
jgi:hypothetical protein